MISVDPDTGKTIYTYPDAAPKTREEIAHWLSQQHTRYLLTIRDHGKNWWSRPKTISHEDVKAELATRPHVPNKRESRGLRLQKIRAGK